MTVDYSQFKMKSSPVWALQPVSPEVQNKACSGDPDNLINRLSDLLGIDANNWGIFPAAAIRNSDASATYYEAYSTVSGSVYYDFLVTDDQSANTVSVGYGLAYDRSGRRIVIGDTDAYAAANPAAVDAWGYAKPKSTGCQDIPVPTSAVATFYLCVSHLPVVESYSNPKTSVDPVSGEVRYTRITDGYEIELLSSAPTDGTHVLLATIVVDISGNFVVTQTAAIRKYIRMPGALVSSPTEGLDGVPLVKTVAQHIQAVGTSAEAYSVVNPHMQKLRDLDGWEEIENSLAASFRAAFANGLIDTTYSNAFAYTGSGSSTITFSNLDTGEYAFVNGYLYTGDQVYNGTTQLDLGDSIPVSPTTQANYYVYLEENNDTDSTHKLQFVLSVSAPVATDQTKLLLCTLTWSGSGYIFNAADNRRFSIVADSSRQADAATAANAVQQSKKISSLEVVGNSTIPTIVGNTNMTTGNLTLTAGNIGLTAGNITLTAGGLTVTAGVISGATLVSTGATTVGTDLTVQGHLNGNTGSGLLTIPGSVSIGGVLTISTLSVLGNFSAGGTITASASSAPFQVPEYVGAVSYASYLPAGTIVMWIGATAPAGYCLIDNSLIAQAETKYPDLWAVVPNGWKSGDAIQLPDWRGLMPMNASGTYPLLDTGGEATHVLTESEMPTHHHAIPQSFGGLDGAAGSPYRYVGAALAGTDTTDVGGSVAHNNLPPYVVVNWILKLAA